MFGLIDQCLGDVLESRLARGLKDRLRTDGKGPWAAGLKDWLAAKGCAGTAASSTGGVLAGAAAVFLGSFGADLAYVLLVELVAAGLTSQILAGLAGLVAARRSMEESCWPW